MSRKLLNTVGSPWHVLKVQAAFEALDPSRNCWAYWEGKQARAQVAAKQQSKGRTEVAASKAAGNNAASALPTAARRWIEQISRYVVECSLKGHLVPAEVYMTINVSHPWLCLVCLPEAPCSHSAVILQRYKSADGVLGDGHYIAIIPVPGHFAE